MSPKIVAISPRGQITIPLSIRNKIKAQHFYCVHENGEVILRPVQSRDEFFAELEEAENDYDKNGGLSLEEMKKKYSIDDEI